MLINKKEYIVIAKRTSEEKYSNISDDYLNIKEE